MNNVLLNQSKNAAVFSVYQRLFICINLNHLYKHICPNSCSKPEVPSSSPLPLVILNIYVYFSGKERLTQESVPSSDAVP